MKTSILFHQPHCGGPLLFLYVQRSLPKFLRVLRRRLTHENLFSSVNLKYKRRREETELTAVRCTVCNNLGSVNIPLSNQDLSRSHTCVYCYKKVYQVLTVQTSATSSYTYREVPHKFLRVQRCSPQSLHVQKSPPQPIVC